LRKALGGRRMTRFTAILADATVTPEEVAVIRRASAASLRQHAANARAQNAPELAARLERAAERYDPTSSIT
jgi:hypothetical protein